MQSCLSDELLTFSKADFTVTGGSLSIGKAILNCIKEGNKAAEEIRSKGGDVIYIKADTGKC